MYKVTDRNAAPAALRVLRVDSSARGEGSLSRAIGDDLIDRLEAVHGPLEVTVRDLAVDAPSFVDAGWVQANFTAEEQRSPAQRAALAESDALVAELEEADVLVIGVPIYNFGIPAALKAWVDLVARARRTFRYTETGPVGLLTGKRAFLAVASGGTAVGSEIDFATGYLRHVLGFLGITEVEIVAADRAMARGQSAVLEAARARIEALVPEGASGQLAAVGGASVSGRAA
jgi:FMN-dependent NADH-azoreductase